ncbi:MAG: hypothetical protein OEQ13_04625 [Acidobacteriota bacterium]|nr:hypothetical protein [Acidobacteriota bacterium]
MEHSNSGVSTVEKGGDHHAPLIGGLALFFVFFVAYGSSGLAASRTFETHEFLGVDHWEWINQNWELYHKGSHPLLMLFMKPFQAVVSVFPGLRGHVFAVMVNAGFGALAVALAFLCYWIFSRRAIHSAVVATLYGCTTGQVVFGSVPESRVIEASVIIATYVLLAASLDAPRLRLPVWVAAGLLTFGVTITHFFHSLSAFTGATFYHRDRWPIARIVRYGALVLALAVVLALLQKAIVRESKLFFMPETVEREMQYTTFEKSVDPRQAARGVLFNFGAFSIVSPKPWIGKARPLRVASEKEMATPGVTPTMAQFIPVKLKNTNFTPTGKAGVILWGILILVGLVRNVRSLLDNSRRRATLLVAGAAIAFTMMLHSVYGYFEVYLYLCSFTFPIVLFVIDPEFKSRLYTASIAALAVTAGWNNWKMLLDVVASAS